MSDWDFLHDMHNDGYSADQIADAAACGYNPWEYEPIDLGSVDSLFSNHLVKKPKNDIKSRDGYPYSAFEQEKIFYDLIDCATRHRVNTGRYLQIWGELGEIFAEIEFGLRRHGTHEPGSDGEINGELVEVKTISPEKSNDRVLVKSKGNFEKLLIIRIDEHFNFEGRLFDRAELMGGVGKYLRGKFDNGDQFSDE